MATTRRRAAAPAEESTFIAPGSQASAYRPYPSLVDAVAPDAVIAGHLQWLTANADHWLAGEASALKPSLAMFSDAVLKSAAQLAALKRQDAPDPLGDLNAVIDAAQSEADALLANLQ